MGIISFLRGPHSPSGRIIRIKRMIEKGEDPKAAKCLVFLRDYHRNYKLSTEELLFIKSLQKNIKDEYVLLLKDNDLI